MAEKTTTATATATTTATPWFEGVAGVTPELVGHFQNRGLHTKTAAEAAVNLAVAHREAEGKLGIPADQIIRLPKDASDEAGWNALWGKLGKPAEAKDYDLSAVKDAAGNPIDAALAGFFRGTAHKLNLSKENAAALASEIQKFNDGKAVSAKAETDAKIVSAKADLAKNWGANAEANKFVAQQAAKALGVDPETVAALENQLGYSKVMEMFRQIGARIGEDKYVTGGSGAGANGVMTREQAMAKKGELMKDTAWAGRYMAGGAPEAREMTALNTLIVGTTRAA